MSGSSTEHRIFLSYARGDTPYAVKMRALLATLGIDTLPGDETLPEGAPFQEQVQQRAADATITIVLIGPTTRHSRWVDMEIDLTTSPKKGRFGAGLIGVVLPTHVDFSKPYYEPELVPIRLHDRILAEYAILKKWTEDAATVRCWIDEAERRRKHYDSIPSIGAMLQLRSFAWAEEADSRTPDSTPQ